MAIEVAVGPPLVTINRGDTFVLSEPDGCITAYTDQGIYSRDTRYVSNYEIFVDGERWVLQNSGAVAYYASQREELDCRLLLAAGATEQPVVLLHLQPDKLRANRHHPEDDCKFDNREPVRSPVIC